MSCPCCGAPQPARGVVCAYCGNRRDLDLQGWAHLQAIASDQTLHCPDCRTPLETLELEEPAALRLARCPGCLGLFLPLGGLESLLDQAVGRVWDVDYPLLHALAEAPRTAAAPVRYRPCPQCGELMNRNLQGKRSGVVVDRCRDHGLWLDAGELRALMEWARAGGELLHQERLQQREWEEQRREQQRAEALQIAEETERSWWELAASEDLGDLLVRLARRLL
jgi:Zn-finger nucleic acid-binding protein